MQEAAEFPSCWRSEETARVAQLVEHTLGKGEVIGSIPIASLVKTRYV